MTNKQIKDLIQKIELFANSFGAYPNVYDIIKSYQRNQEEIGEDYSDFRPLTAFEAFCELYFVENKESNKIVYNTFMVLYDRK